MVGWLPICCRLICARMSFSTPQDLHLAATWQIRITCVTFSFANPGKPFYCLVPSWNFSIHCQGILNPISDIGHFFSHFPTSADHPVGTNHARRGKLSLFHGIKSRLVCEMWDAHVPVDERSWHLFGYQAFSARFWEKTKSGLND